MDVSDAFTIPAASNTPSIIPDTAMQYTISVASGQTKPLIQATSTYTLRIDSPVPLEIATAGCFLEVEFPRELKIAAEARTYTGKHLLASAGTSATLTASEIILEDFSGPRALLVLKGCAQMALAGQSKVSTILEFVMPAITNPYSEKDTSPFNIKIFNSYDAATKTGSLQIAESTTFVIPGSAYATGAISDIKLTAASYVIQEATTQYYQFKIANEIPGTQDAGGATDIQAGVHIHFPSSFLKDVDGTDSGAVTVAGAGVSITGTPSATVDTTAYYDPQCQASLCYLVAFETAQNIPGSTVLTVTIKNLLNPVTVKPAGDVRITTVMRYTTPADGRYYQIDTLRAPSNFIATVGSIDSSSISLAGGPSNTQMTFAEMQTY